MNCRLKYARNYKDKDESSVLHILTLRAGPQFNDSLMITWLNKNFDILRKALTSKGDKLLSMFLFFFQVCFWAENVAPGQFSPTNSRHHRKHSVKSVETQFGRKWSVTSVMFRNPFPYRTGKRLIIAKRQTAFG